MTKSPNRLLASVFGAVYLLVGLLGFAYTGGVNFFATVNDNLLVGLFAVNPFHNVAHLLIGAALLIAGPVERRGLEDHQHGHRCGVPAARHRRPVPRGSELNILAINGADNVLHFGSAVILLAVGLGADKGVRRTTATA